MFIFRGSSHKPGVYHVPPLTRGRRHRIGVEGSGLVTIYRRSEEVWTKNMNGSSYTVGFRESTGGKGLC